MIIINILMRVLIVSFFSVLKIIGCAGRVEISAVSTVDVMQYLVRIGD